MTSTVLQTTWFQELWPRLTAATGVGYLATAYTVSRWLTRRSPAAIEHPTGIDDARIESLRCTTADGIALTGWCVEPARPLATVALFHGLRLNRGNLLGRIAFLGAAGYRCVAFDHRAHGESGGAVTSFGLHERHDVAAVARLLRDRWPHSPRAALGISMGAAALCFADETAHVFDAVILESLYHDLARAFQHRVGRGYPGWFRHFRRGIIWFTERRLGARIHEVAPISHIAKLASLPVLLLTGSDDPHAPPHEGQALADKLAQSCRFHVIPGAAHDDVCDKGGTAYQDLLLEFLQEHLTAKPEA